MPLHIKISYVEYAESAWPWSWEWELVDLDTDRVIEVGYADTWHEAEQEANEALAAYEKETAR